MRWRGPILKWCWPLGQKFRLASKPASQITARHPAHLIHSPSVRTRLSAESAVLSGPEPASYSPSSRLNQDILALSQIGKMLTAGALSRILKCGCPILRAFCEGWDASCQYSIPRWSQLKGYLNADQTTRRNLASRCSTPRWTTLPEGSRNRSRGQSP